MEQFQKVGKKALKQVARAFEETRKDYYFGNITEIDAFSQMCDMFGCIIEQLQKTPNGLITPLVRVITHYAATSTDTDKAAVIEVITQKNGVCDLLERVEAGGDIIDVWADFFDNLNLDFGK